nr:hypothetical protein [Pandoravirus massiliensis]
MATTGTRQTVWGFFAYQLCVLGIPARDRAPIDHHWATKPPCKIGAIVCFGLHISIERERGVRPCSFFSSAGLVSGQGNGSGVWSHNQLFFPTTDEILCRMADGAMSAPHEGKQPAPMYRLRELLNRGAHEVIGALGIFVVDEGRPYDPCRSRLLKELAALPQPLTMYGGTNKRPQYYIDMARATLNHARMSIASASFFIDGSTTTDKLVVLRGLTRSGNKWRICVERGPTQRHDKHPTYMATIKMAGTVFENRIVAGSRPG